MAKRHKIANCACLNLRAAARSITQYYDRELRRVGLRSTQFNLLAAVQEVGPASMTNLAGALGMDRTTLNRDLKPLRRDGLVTIRKGRDRRVRLISLTGMGRERLEAAYPVWRGLQDEVHGCVGKKRWKSLMKELSHTTKAVQKASC